MALASEAPSFPRWTLAILGCSVGSIWMWAAWTLPWTQWTLFSFLTTLVALVHLATGVAAALGSSARVRLWRWQALVALAYLAYVTWNVVQSAVYIVALYGGLGQGIAAALGLVWLIAVALVVPLSAWGLVVSGGIRWRVRQRAATAAAVVLVAAGLGRATALASADAVSATSPTVAAIDARLATVRSRPALADSLLITEPVACERPIDVTGATIVITALRLNEVERPVPYSACLQGASFDEVLDALQGAVAETVGTRMKIDVVTARQQLQEIAPVVDSLSLRPGLDGVCDGDRCLMPWQLLALDVFTSHGPISVIPELRFGADAVAIRRSLGRDHGGPVPTLAGLVRVETDSFVTDLEGNLHALDRLRVADEPVTPHLAAKGKRGAEAYILQSQATDGRFLYRLDPFSGQVSYRGFSLARQAGTTLVLCELAEDLDRAVDVIERALEMMASTELVVGELGALAFPKERRRHEVALGPTALSAIAFLRCREHMGETFDGVTERLAKFLLTMQRPNGGFFPEFSLDTGEPIDGPDPLYAAGQAVFALTLLEEIVKTQPHAFAFEHGAVRAAVERAMSYYSGAYWDIPAREFFFVEENWHCLAARAALGHHRHDGYERFCLDYVDFKRRLILDEESRVRSDLVGGYGFGNVILPHNTGAAGFGEAFAASMALRRARGEQKQEDRRVLALILGFLLHHQWDSVSCFACAPDHRVVGAFSEHMGSPHIRIDYVQHAMAVLGHGGPLLAEEHDGAR